MKGLIIMKKILSLIICSVMILSFYSLAPSAVPVLTLDEAEDLIRQMADFETTVTGDFSESKYHIVIGYLHGDTVTDTEILKKLRKQKGLDENDDRLEFYELRDEYGTASFWFDRLKNFLTDEYVEEHIALRRSLLQLGDNVYTLDGAGYVGAPDFPALKGGKTIKECIAFIDDDTVILEAEYGGYTKRQINFEYTENGWRISGGDGTQEFLRTVYKDEIQNPETNDGLTAIIICLAMSALGICVTLGERRFSR